jgi:fluoroquinolone resistance protein
MEGATPLPAEIRSAAHHAQCRFEKASLTGEHVTGTEFVGVTFVRCDFSEAAFETCRFSDCVFDRCNLNLVQLPGSTLANVAFNDSQLMGVDWTRVDWPRLPTGRRISFSNCTVSHSTFIGLSLPEIRLVRCAATDVDFREADLSRGSFAGTDLAESLFLNTDLTQTDFSTARNYRIDPAQNKISQAKFSLPEALSLLYSMDIEMVELPPR